MTVYTRHNTRVSTFYTECPRLTAYAIHNWIHEFLKVEESDTLMIEIDGPKRLANIKIMAAQRPIDVEKEHTPRLLTHTFTDTKKSLYKNIHLEQKRTKSLITHQRNKKIFQSSTSSPPWSISRGMASCTGRLILVLSGRRRLTVRI